VPRCPVSRGSSDGSGAGRHDQVPDEMPRRGARHLVDTSFPDDVLPDDVPDTSFRTPPSGGPDWGIGIASEARTGSGT
jgi:hypothetical protein